MLHDLARCNAATDVGDNPRAAVYCGATAEGLAMLAASISRSELWASIRLNEVLNLKRAANAHFSYDRPRAEQQYRSALAIVEDLCIDYATPERRANAKFLRKILAAHF